MATRPISKRHHYLPVKYLNGFTNPQNGFYVYDKREDRIFKSSPVDTFFEKHLNTVEFPNGDKDDVLEGLYEKMERTSWPSFDRIRSSTHKNHIDIIDKAHLFRFLLFLHWRLPSNIPLSDHLSTRAFSDDENINYFEITGKDGETAPDELLDTLRDSPVFKKWIKLIAPSAPFYKDVNWFKTLDNWRFLYPGDDRQWYIVGDSPILTEGHYDHDPVKCLEEFVFPISGKIMLVNTTIPVKTGFPPTFVVLYCTTIFQRAERFVASPNETFLKHIRNLYKEHVKHGATHIIIPELFKVIKEASNG